jgi:flagellar protein FlaJ
MYQAIFASLLGVGIFFILADLFSIPTLRTTKAMTNLTNKGKKKDKTLELWLSDLASFVAKIIRLNEYSRMQLLADLQSANMTISPEQHIANAIVKAAICGVFAIPTFFILPIITPVMIILAFAMYFKESKGITTRIKKKRETIELELPRFVFTIQKKITHSRNIIEILDEYRDIAGAEFKVELDITVADMRSGNGEAALIRLESRVGSAMLSDVVRGLISVFRGDETSNYWTALSIKFADIQRQILNAQAMKVPRKVKRLSMVLLFCFMITYIVVIVFEIITSLGAMFA